MKIFALFDDPDEIQKARDAIEKEGRGDEVVKVVSPHLDTNQTRVTPVMGQGGGTGAAAVDQAGQTAPQGTVDDAIAVLGRLDLPAEQREYFERRLQSKKAQVLVLETDDDDAEDTQNMLKEYGAQYVATN